MTGEMTKSEVVRPAYPGLFALRDALKRRGIDAEPRPFDKYQGPYLSAGHYRIWQVDSYYRGAGPVEAWTGDRDGMGAKLRRVDTFIIEGPDTFETSGAGRIEPEDGRNYPAGVYTLRQAAKRIAEVVK